MADQNYWRLFEFSMSYANRSKSLTIIFGAALGGQQSSDETTSGENGIFLQTALASTHD